MSLCRSDLPLSSAIYAYQGPDLMQHQIRSFLLAGIASAWIDRPFPVGILINFIPLFLCNPPNLLLTDTSIIVILDIDSRPSGREKKEGGIR
jgi:hypothetical protein